MKEASIFLHLFLDTHEALCSLGLVRRSHCFPVVSLMNDPFRVASVTEPYSWAVLLFEFEMLSIYLLVSYGQMGILTWEIKVGCISLEPSPGPTLATADTGPRLARRFRPSRHQRKMLGSTGVVSVQCQVADQYLTKCTFFVFRVHWHLLSI